METIENAADNIFREIRRIEIYRSENLSYIDNFQKKKPSGDAVLEIQNIIPEDFDRFIKRKTTGGNTFFDIEISLSSYNVDPENINKLNNLLNDKDFVAVFYSNMDYTVLGNHTEPLGIFILDNRKYNDSGNDLVTISITGSTKVIPFVCPL